jgi:pSer/pThr/pTyr-binding forkhead associated (FHA) protein
MKNILSRLEAHIQNIIEGGASRLLPHSTIEQELAQQLIAVMRNGAKADDQGQIFAPDYYVIILSPAQARALQENTAVIDGLSNSLVNSAKTARILFKTPPIVRIVEDPDYYAPDMHIRAGFNQDQAGITKAGSLNPDNLEETISSSSDFLIVNGTMIFPLTKPVINIGRREENDLVLDDLQVSRQHAQLRMVKGRYIIFDLDSTSGTLVNNQPISQHILNPGDVISLAGNTLVFGQDLTQFPDATQELKL